LTTSILQTLPFFAGLDEASLEGLERVAEVRTLPDAGVLFREGDPREEMYVVLRGHLNIVKGLVGAEAAVVATLTVGSILGEGSIFETGTRTASAVAQGETEVLSIPAGPFQDWLLANPASGVVVLGRLGSTLLDRLSSTSELLRAARRWAAEVSGAAKLSLDHVVADGGTVHVQPTSGPEVVGPVVRVEKGPAGVELWIRTDRGTVMVPYSRIAQLRIGNEA